MLGMGMLLLRWQSCNCAFLVDKITDCNCAICGWNVTVIHGGECTVQACQAYWTSLLVMVLADLG